MSHYSHLLSLSFNCCHFRAIAPCRMGTPENPTGVTAVDSKHHGCLLFVFSWLSPFCIFLALFFFFPPKASYQFQVSRAQKGETRSPYLMPESQQQLIKGHQYWRGVLGPWGDLIAVPMKGKGLPARCIAENSVFCLSNKTLKEKVSFI